MALYDDFVKSLLPGNYALTKSMELTKVSDSGTLWYTKKFLTLYYYIFLSNEIMTMTYKHNVVAIFDNYIASLPAEVQESAEKYFYPENEAINFKSENFNLFSNFAGLNRFETQDERRSYYQSAKKYYFSLLMGSGGQTGIKKMLKEAVQRSGFVYSHDNIDKIILDSAIEICMNYANGLRNKQDNSVKYILSDEAIEQAVIKASISPVNEDDIRQLNEDYPLKKSNYRSIENDMVAFIRNERQILYYYGFFHSKSSGATDFEFSSLTPIGELALKANANEFLAIWEHQKIKMISQPANADINDIPEVDNSADNFGISYTPYTDILGHLYRRGEMSLDEYKYIVSRKKHCFDEEAWIKEEEDILNNLESIYSEVCDFKRKGDCAGEDGRKELVKYLLGVRNDLPVDKNSNLLGILKFNKAVVSVENQDVLGLIYSVYTKLENYKIQKYRTVFEDSEAELKRRYIATVNGEDSVIDRSVKIHWDLYNIHPDNFILISIATTIAIINIGINSTADIKKDDVISISAYINENFNELFRMLGVRSLSAIKKEVKKVMFALKNDDYSNYIGESENRSETVLARYRTESATDLFERIKQISDKAIVSPAETRERNSMLISLLKSYYISHYAEDNMLKCECCGEETFLNSAGEPYVEFHHLIPFNIAYGPDHYLNLFELCPNCHRKIHFMSVKNKQIQYKQLSDNNYMNWCFTDRLQELKEKSLLRSYHLEFLLADNAITSDEYNAVAV